MMDSSNTSSKPAFADHEAVSVNNQCMERQAMLSEVYVVISDSVANQFNLTTGWRKMLLNEIQCDWNVDAPRQVSHADSAIFGIYVTCFAGAQDTGYRLIKRDCRTAQAYYNLEELSARMIDALDVPHIGSSYDSVSEGINMDLISDLSQGRKHLVYVDVLKSLAPFMGECIADQVYKRFESLYAAFLRAHNWENLDAVLSVTICLPPDIPIEAINLLRSYFRAG